MRCESEPAFDANGLSIQQKWPKTPAGSQATLSCPPGYQGAVNRKCQLRDGKWESVKRTGGESSNICVLSHCDDSLTWDRKSHCIAINKQNTNNVQTPQIYNYDDAVHFQLPAQKKYRRVYENLR
eukprot:Nk52_evm35s343 gene=Nk52_evmTU35s343